MNSWNNTTTTTTTTTDQVGFQFPNHIQTKHFGIDNDLVELLWQDGELVLHNQINKKQSYDEYGYDDPSKLMKQDNDDHTTSWIDDCPIDESFEKEFCANFLSEIPSSPNHVTSQHPPFAPIPLPPPQIGTFHHHHNSGGVNHELPVLNRTEQGGVPECSVMTMGSSHCGSNQVDMSGGSSTGVQEKFGRKISPCSERETIGQAITSCSGGTTQSNSHKRKSRDVEESECRSDATELESSSGKKSRRIRVAEVHNLSERRRRDRINEKMKALQELIPHSNKSDKASMLDEAIEYMKSLQLQLQLMWMGSGMQQYMAPAMFQNVMRASPLFHQAMNMSNQAQRVNYSNQMQNPSFQEQYANYMAFHSTPNTSQAMNMFNLGFHSAQQNQVSAPPGSKTL